jgi:hypothetical protein
MTRGGHYSTELLSSETGGKFQNLEYSLSPRLELMNTKCGIVFFRGVEFDDYRTWNMLLAWN